MGFIQWLMQCFNECVALTLSVCRKTLKKFGSLQGDCVWVVTEWRGLTKAVCVWGGGDILSVTLVFHFSETTQLWDSSAETQTKPVRCVTTIKFASAATPLSVVEVWVQMCDVKLLMQSAFHLYSIVSRQSLISLVIACCSLLDQVVWQGQSQWNRRLGAI